MTNNRISVNSTRLSKVKKSFNGGICKGFKRVKMGINLIGLLKHHFNKALLKRYRIRNHQEVLDKRIQVCIIRIMQDRNNSQLQFKKANVKKIKRR